ncbi:hypothetical protein O181_003391 [Austropuccinia psidii MF-1]|uniref:Uncharacterized protein n=1 Tax=Austropuccinia psidii MF-1 TaxID=1389203 RepID=A0A9Q3GE42_9BASI|nr:hypothetical protein [Austropuccinia psidii MF-1]
MPTQIIVPTDESQNLIDNPKQKKSKQRSNHKSKHKGSVPDEDSAPKSNPSQPEKQLKSSQSIPSMPITLPQAELRSETEKAHMDGAPSTQTTSKKKKHKESIKNTLTDTTLSGGNLTKTLASPTKATKSIPEPSQNLIPSNKSLSSNSIQTSISTQTQNKADKQENHVRKKIRPTTPSKLSTLSSLEPELSTTLTKTKNLTSNTISITSPSSHIPHRLASPPALAPNRPASPPALAPNRPASPSALASTSSNFQSSSGTISATGKKGRKSISALAITPDPTLTSSVSKTFDQPSKPQNLNENSPHTLPNPLKKSRKSISALALNSTPTRTTPILKTTEQPPIPLPTSSQHPEKNFSSSIPVSTKKRSKSISGLFSTKNLAPTSCISKASEQICEASSSSNGSLAQKTALNWAPFETTLSLSTADILAKYAPPNAVISKEPKKVKKPLSSSSTKTFQEVLPLADTSLTALSTSILSVDRQSKSSDAQPKLKEGQSLQQLPSPVLKASSSTIKKSHENEKQNSQLARKPTATELSSSTSAATDVPAASSTGMFTVMPSTDLQTKTSSGKSKSKAGRKSQQLASQVLQDSPSTIKKSHENEKQSSQIAKTLTTAELSSSIPPAPDVPDVSSTAISTSVPSANRQTQSASGKPKSKAVRKSQQLASQVLQDSPSTIRQSHENEKQSSQIAKTLTTAELSSSIPPAPDVPDVSSTAASTSVPSANRQPKSSNSKPKSKATRKSQELTSQVSQDSPSVSSQIAKTLTATDLSSSISPALDVLDASSAAISTPMASANRQPKSSIDKSNSKGCQKSQQLTSQVLQDSSSTIKKKHENKRQNNEIGTTFNTPELGSSITPVSVPDASSTAMSTSMPSANRQTKSSNGKSKLKAAPKSQQLTSQALQDSPKTAERGHSSERQNNGIATVLNTTESGSSIAPAPDVPDLSSIAISTSMPSANRQAKSVNDKPSSMRKSNPNGKLNNQIPITPNVTESGLSILPASNVLKEANIMAGSSAQAEAQTADQPNPRTDVSALNKSTRSAESSISSNSPKAAFPTHQTVGISNLVPHVESTAPSKKSRRVSRSSKEKASGKEAQVSNHEPSKKTNSLLLVSTEPVTNSNLASATITSTPVLTTQNTLNKLPPVHKSSSILNSLSLMDTQELLSQSSLSDPGTGVWQELSATNSKPKTRSNLQPEQKVGKSRVSSSTQLEDETLTNQSRNTSNLKDIDHTALENTANEFRSVNNSLKVKRKLQSSTDSHAIKSTRTLDKHQTTNAPTPHPVSESIAQPGLESTETEWSCENRRSQIPGNTEHTSENNELKRASASNSSPRKRQRRKPKTQVPFQTINNKEVCLEPQNAASSANMELCASVPVPNSKRFGTKQPAAATNDVTESHSIQGSHSQLSINVENSNPTKNTRKKSNISNVNQTFLKRKHNHTSSISVKQPMLGTNPANSSAENSTVDRPLKKVKISNSALSGLSGSSHRAGAHSSPARPNSLQKQPITQRSLVDNEEVALEHSSSLFSQEKSCQRSPNKETTAVISSNKATDKNQSIDLTRNSDNPSELFGKWELSISPSDHVSAPVLARMQQFIDEALRAGFAKPVDVPLQPQDKPFARGTNIDVPMNYKANVANALEPIGSTGNTTPSANSNIASQSIINGPNHPISQLSASHAKSKGKVAKPQVRKQDKGKVEFDDKACNQNSGTKVAQVSLALNKKPNDTMLKSSLAGKQPESQTSESSTEESDSEPWSSKAVPSLHYSRPLSSPEESSEESLFDDTSRPYKVLMSDSATEPPLPVKGQMARKSIEKSANKNASMRHDAALASVSDVSSSAESNDLDDTVMMALELGRKEGYGPQSDSINMAKCPQHKSPVRETAGPPQEVAVSLTVSEVNTLSSDADMSQNSSTTNEFKLKSQDGVQKLAKLGRSRTRGPLNLNSVKSLEPTVADERFPILPSCDASNSISSSDSSTSKPSPAGVDNRRGDSLSTSDSSEDDTETCDDDRPPPSAQRLPKPDSKAKSAVEQKKDLSAFADPPSTSQGSLLPTSQSSSSQIQARRLLTTRRKTLDAFKPVDFSSSHAPSAMNSISNHFATHDHSEPEQDSSSDEESHLSDADHDQLIKSSLGLPAHKLAGIKSGSKPSKPRKSAVELLAKEEAKIINSKKSIGVNLN